MILPTIFQYYANKEGTKFSLKPLHNLHFFIIITLNDEKLGITFF